MLLLTISEFLNSGAAKIVFGIVCAGFLYLMYRVATKSTAPKDPMINTGEPWKPGENKPPVDNRPDPKPPFDKNNPL
jgi:hypothetical protein